MLETRILFLGICRANQPTFQGGLQFSLIFEILFTYNAQINHQREPDTKESELTVQQENYGGQIWAGLWNPGPDSELLNGGTLI